MCFHTFLSPVLKTPSKLHSPTVPKSMWCPQWCLAEAECDGRMVLGQSPEQPCQGTIRHWGYKSGPRNCPASAAGAWPRLGQGEGDPLLPRDAFAHRVALSWQGSLEGGKEPTNSLLSPRAHQEASNPCHNLVLQQKGPPEDLHSQSLSWGMEVSTCCCLALHFPVKSTSGVQPWQNTSQVLVPKQSMAGEV